MGNLSYSKNFATNSRISPISEKFRRKIEKKEAKIRSWQGLHDLIPKVIIMNGQTRHDIFIRIDQEAQSGRCIKIKANELIGGLEGGKFSLRFLSGRPLEDEERIVGTSHLVLNCVPESAATNRYKPY